MGTEKERGSVVIVRAVLSLYKRVRTRVKVGYVLLDEFEVKVAVQQGSTKVMLFMA